MQSVEILELEVEQQIEVLTPQRLECVYHSLAVNVCLNSNCLSFVFLCGDKTCECYKQHKGCIKGSIESINEAIEEKLTFIEPFQKRIDELIENAVNELSLYRDRIILKAKQDLNFIGLTENERRFLKALKTKKVDQLTGRQMNQIFSSIDNATGFDEKMKRIGSQIETVWNNFNRSMKITFSRVESLLQIFTGNISFQFTGSAIIKTQEQKSNMRKFFDKKVEQTTLLYRASENDFQVSPFYENTQNIKNTLIICQTEYGKLIGGFSASTWKVQSNDTRWGDDSGDSFVFSLTSLDKFTMQQRGYCFRYLNGYGPMFGNQNGTDFFITNRANKERDCGGNINNGYWNGKYTKDNRESWEMFTGGNQDFRFTVREWEVWHLKFDEFKWK